MIPPDPQLSINVYDCLRAGIVIFMGAFVAFLIWINSDR